MKEEKKKPKFVSDFYFYHFMVWNLINYYYYYYFPNGFGQISLNYKFTNLLLNHLEFYFVQTKDIFEFFEWSNNF